MKTLKIKIHSFVDVITNSSTTTYVMADDKSVDLIKTLVEKIITLSGGTKTFDDLFEIGFSIDSDSIWDLDEDDSKEAQKIKEICNKKYITKEEKEKVESFCESQYDKYNIDSDIVLIAKTLEGENIMPSINSLFNFESEYDG